MGVYGIRITPDDGGTQIQLDGSMRYASFLGGAAIPAQSGSNGGFKVQPSNSKTIIVPRSLVRVIGPTSGGQTPMAFVSGLSFSGNTLNYSVELKSANPGSTQIGYVDVFSVAYAASSTSGYGLRVTNGANFLEINDTSYLGFVTYRSVITVNGSWSIPQNIVNMGNYIVFARWSNTDTPLFLDRDSNTIRAYQGFGSSDGSVEGGSVSNIQIVIVSCGFSPAIPDGRYGLIIRNSAGQITYSSKYPPVAWSDAYYDFGSYQQYGDSSGETLSWVNPTGNVQLPMVPLCTLGLQRGDFNRNAGNYNFRKCLYSGFKMSGNSVSTARAKSTFADIEVYNYPRAVQVACQLPCIDAAYYF